MYIPGSRKDFVDWEERLVSHGRGSRVVHYYLKDSNGVATLAVVGSERSVRHMVYVVSDDFLLLAGLDKMACQSVKWRSRREVVDWLSKFVANPRINQEPSKSPKYDSCSGSDNYLTSNGEYAGFLDVPLQNEGQNQTGIKSTKKQKATFVGNIIWVGDAWVCRKCLQHYRSFQKNGITFSLHNFVYMKLEGNGHEIAYIEDMYEDRKSKKKLRVRWFYKSEDMAGLDPHLVTHPREVFLSPFPQVLSVECVDRMATILSPEHYEKCMLMLPDVLTQIHLCSRQFNNEGFKFLNISSLKGYWHQKVLASMNLSPVPRVCSPNLDSTGDSLEMDGDEIDLMCMIKRGRRTRRSRKRTSMDSWIQSGYFTSAECVPQSVNINEPSSVCRSISGELQSAVCNRDIHGKDSISSGNVYPTFDVGDKVELLCEDSGIRGCWFRCTVLKKTAHHLKVCYDDLDADDGNGILEEWVSSAKVAFCDRLGLRMPDRYTMRPSSEHTIQGNYDVGSVVDAWWNDGWWEGLVLCKRAKEFLVFFPDENDFAAFESSDLRCSRDWCNGQWVDIKSSEAVMKSVCSVFMASPMCHSLPHNVITCLQQNLFSSSNLAKSSSIIPSFHKHSERCLSDDVSDKHCFQHIHADEVKKFVVPLSSESNMSVQVDATDFCEAKALLTGSKLEENTQLRKGSNASSSPVEEAHLALNASREDEAELKWSFSKKRQRQVDKINSPKSWKSNLASSGVGIGETSEGYLLEKWGWNGSGGDVLLPSGFSEKGEHENTSDKEKVKVKKTRAAHDSLKPLHGSTNGNSFMSSVPLVGLVMSR